jgi:uncharacterized protein (DUF433 family)
METYHDRIEKKPDVMLGKPVIKGTRIPVELVIRKLGEGASIPDLLDAYPNIVEKDIHAALLYTAEYLTNETFIYLDTGT